MAHTNKKAQIKMGETLGVMIIFFFLIGISFAFYATYQKGSIEQTIEERFEQQAVRIALKATYAPELVCSQDRDIEEENCVDKFKLDAFKNLILNNQETFLFYESDFGQSKITIREVYPGTIQEWLIYDNGLEEGEFQDKVVLQSPIVIKDPANPNPLQQRSIGTIIIEVFQ